MHINFLKITPQKAVCNKKKKKTIFIYLFLIAEKSVRTLLTGFVEIASGKTKKDVNVTFI